MCQSLMGLLILLAPLQAEERSEPATPRQRYEALLKQHTGSPGTYANDPEKAKVAAHAFLDLAREHPDDDAAVDALGWVATHCLFQPQAGEAMRILAQSHTGSEHLAKIIKDIFQYYGDPFEPVEGLCRAAMEESPHREVRGWARYALARYLRKAKEKAERDSFQNGLYLEGKKVPFVAAPRLTPADLERLAEEAAALLKQVVEEHGKAGRDKAGLVAAAKAELSELQEISLGKVAPDIVGRDIVGKTFKLSDYRGKVVVLTFSGNWCPPCRAMYPAERELVERLRDAPFALLSVNTDEDKGVLRKSIESGEITWRCWYDGGREGPITARWNVDGFPTVYVLDAAGVIRYKNPQGKSLNEAVDTLLKQNQSSDKLRSR